MRHTTSHDTRLSLEPAEDPDVVVDRLRDNIIDIAREFVGLTAAGQELALDPRELRDAVQELEQAEREARA